MGQMTKDKDSRTDVQDQAGAVPGTHGDHHPLERPRRGHVSS